MKTPQDTRRNFLFQTASGFGSAWIALHWPAVLRAHEHRCKAVADPNARFEFFSPTEAAEIDALSAQIIPSDDGSPGARQAGVIFFIDNALVTFDRERQALYKDGLATLQSRTQEMFPDVTAFSKLESEQQIQLLIAIEKTDFFETVRVHTIMGFLADPSYGGNRNQVGWKLIGFESKASNKPPFGYYDAKQQS